MRWTPVCLVVINKDSRAYQPDKVSYAIRLELKKQIHTHHFRREKQLPRALAEEVHQETRSAELSEAKFQRVHRRYDIPNVIAGYLPFAV